jgi:hypothetical protein
MSRVEFPPPIEKIGKEHIGMGTNEPSLPSWLWMMFKMKSKNK